MQTSYVSTETGDATAKVKFPVAKKIRTFRLKPNTQSDYTRTFENQILPLLQKQKGFKEEITMCNSNNVDAVSISLWENKADADNYNTNTYPQVLKTFQKVIDGTPRVHTYETVTSTVHSAVTA